MHRFAGEIFGIKHTKYPDLIAELSLNIQDDLCLMESQGEQKLLAASICSPSYWDVRTKIGKPLKTIHDPVTSLDEKIGREFQLLLDRHLLKNPLLDKIGLFMVIQKDFI